MRSMYKDPLADTSLLGKGDKTFIKNICILPKKD